jgi:hypothetical protein
VTQAAVGTLVPGGVTGDSDDDRAPLNPLDWTEADQPTYVPLSRTRRQADLIALLMDERDEAMRLLAKQRELREAVVVLLRRYLSPHYIDFTLGTTMCRGCGGRADGFFVPLVHADWCHIGRVEALLRH